MRFRFSIYTLALCAVMSVSSAAQASEPRLLGTFGDWSAYTFKENGKTVCYMASQPQKAEGDYTKRGDVYALITHRPAENTKNVFSYIAGYPYKPGADVTVNANSTTFKLFSQDDTAWTPDAAADNAITAAIRQGSNMIVKGYSKRGTLTTDTFSLKGSGAAYDAISEECGL